LNWKNIVDVRDEEVFEDVAVLEQNMSGFE
jgi:hypothetical protein